jgi:hypothetical protein
VNRFFKFSIRSWDERIDVLAEQNEWLEAIALGMKCIKLRKKLDQLENLSQLSDRLLIILLRYSVSFFQNSSNTIEEVKEFACLCMDVCSKIERTDFLFSQILDIFQTADAENVFLESLEVYILNDRIKFVDYPILKSFLGFFINMSRSKELERSLMHLDIQRYEKDQLKELLIHHSLYRALISFNLFVSENNWFIDHMLKRLDELSDDLDKDDSDYIFLIFMYIRFSFEGENILKTKTCDIFQQYSYQVRLLRDLFVDKPYLTRTFLRIDPGYFTSVLEIIFEKFPQKPLKKNEKTALTNEHKSTDVKSGFTGDLFLNKVTDVKQAMSSMVGGIQNQVLKFQGVFNPLRNSSQDISRSSNHEISVSSKNESEVDEVVEIEVQAPSIQEISNLLLEFLMQEDLSVITNIFFFF